MHYVRFTTVFFRNPRSGMVVAVNLDNFFAVTALGSKEVEFGEQGPTFWWQEKEADRQSG